MRPRAAGLNPAAVSMVLLSLFSGLPLSLLSAMSFWGILQKSAASFSFLSLGSKTRI